MKPTPFTALFLAAAAVSPALRADGPVKKVLMEEFTATWCSFCPEAAVALGKLHKEDSRFIIVSFHAGGDNMTLPFTGDYLEDVASITGWPTVFMDRRPEEVDPRRPENREVLEQQLATPADVGIAFKEVRWNAATRTVGGTLEATFTRPLSGDHRIGLFITEDKVVGGSGPATLDYGKPITEPSSEAGYDQASDRETARHFPGLEYVGGEIRGYPHAHVARAAPFGVEGKAGSIPAQAVAGAPYSLPFTYVIPERYDPTELGRPVNLGNIALVAFVARKATSRTSGAILNSEEVLLSSFQGPSAMGGLRSPGRLAYSGAVSPIRDGKVRIHSAGAGLRTVTLRALDGRLLAQARVSLEAGWNTVPLSGRGGTEPNGLALVEVR